MWGNNNTDENDSINKSEVIGATKIIKNEQNQVIIILRELHNDVQRGGGNKNSLYLINHS
jgi:hypothetical protein